VSASPCKNLGKSEIQLRGHNVLEAPAYSDLLDSKFDGVPDAVFIGADSVDAKAVEIVSHVRRLRAHVPIIFASCDNSEAMEITWSDVPNAFLMKPFELSGLNELISLLVCSSAR